jgi:predicted HTH domain antitoxin
VHGYAFRDSVHVSQHTGNENTDMAEETAQPSICNDNSITWEVTYDGSKHFDVVLPEEVVAGFGWTEGEVSARVREALVIELLRQHVISQGKAAELLQLNRWDLSELMGRYKVPAIELTPEELQHELSMARQSHQHL